MALSIAQKCNITLNELATVILILCGFCICKPACFLKFMCNPWISTHSPSVVICGHAQSSGNWVTHWFAPHWGWARQRCLLSCFSSQTVSVLFMIYLVLHFSHFCVFCWCFHCLKQPPTIMLRYCLAFLSEQRLYCAVWRKYVLGTSDSATGHEFNANESTIHILKMSLNRNTHRTRRLIDRLKKILCPEAHMSLTLYFLLRTMVPNSLIRCLRWLYRTWMRIDFIFKD